MATCPFSRLLAWCAPALCYVLAACAFPPQAVRLAGDAEEMTSMLARVQHVAFPLLLASADWCPFDQESTYGFSLAAEEGSKKSGGDDAGKGIVVSSVHPQSSAAAAGLQIGDRLLAVNTRGVTGSTAEEIMEVVRRLTRARIQPLQLDILRSGYPIRLHLMAVPACQFSVRVIRTDQINGLSNGRQIFVTTGLMRFVRSDDELAWVLAHEIAHNVLGHVQESKLLAMLNALLGATVGTSADQPVSLRSLEVQADYVGVYLMARAGFDFQAVRLAWQRLRTLEGQQAATGQSIEQSHPATDERVEAFEATVEEIDRKRIRGESLDLPIKFR